MWVNPNPCRLCVYRSCISVRQAEALGIPLVTLDTHSTLDVAIDGADEVRLRHVSPYMNVCVNRYRYFYIDKHIHIVTLDTHSTLEVAIDGAGEVRPVYT